jgi:hypothetical protein
MKCLKEVVDSSLQAERDQVEQNKQELAAGTTTRRHFPAVTYVAISLRAMQAIDLGWLVHRKFKYHHYRPPGHGDTPPDTPDADAPGPDEGTAEFVYYCSGLGEPADDVVPVYSTVRARSEAQPIIRSRVLPLTNRRAMLSVNRRRGGAPLQSGRGEGPPRL